MAAPPARARRAAARALIVATLAPLACASEPPTEPPGPPPVFDIAAACAEYVTAHETAAKCGRTYDGPPELVKARRPLFEESCRRWLGAPGSGVTPAVLHACSANIRRMCISYNGMGTVGVSLDNRDSLCDLDLPGTLPDDAPCQYSTQCAGGRCLWKQGCRRCVTPSPVGAPCAPFGCAKGAVCLGCNGGKGINCSIAECGAHVEVNEGAACGGRIACFPWLVCNSNSHSCTLPGAPGAPCQRNDECLFRRCDDRACAAQSPEGGDCGFNGTWGCQDGLFCDESAPATCVRPTAWVPAGAECDVTRRCARGYCDLGKCVTFGPLLGERCDAELQSPRSPLRCQAPIEPFVTECIDGTCQIPQPPACE